MQDYGHEKDRNYRYVLVIIDNFSKFGCKTPLENKNAQTIKDSFENILINSKRKPNLIETDRGKEFYDGIFLKILNNNNIKHYSRSTSLDDFFAERFNLTFRNQLKRPAFERRYTKWIDKLPTRTKQ